MVNYPATFFQYVIILQFHILKLLILRSTLTLWFSDLFQNPATVVELSHGEERAHRALAELPYYSQQTANIMKFSTITHRVCGQFIWYSFSLLTLSARENEGEMYFRIPYTLLKTYFSAGIANTVYASKMCTPGTSIRRKFILNIW